MCSIYVCVCLVCGAKDEVELPMATHHGRPRRDLKLVHLPQSFKICLRLAYTSKMNFAAALLARDQGVAQAVKNGLSVQDCYHLGLELSSIPVARENLSDICLSSLRRYYGLTVQQLQEAIPDLDLQDVNSFGASAVELAQFGFTSRTLLQLGDACVRTADRLGELEIGASGWYVLGLRKTELLQSGFRRHHCTGAGWDYAAVISVFGLTTQEQRDLGIQLLFGSQ